MEPPFSEYLVLLKNRVTFSYSFILYYTHIIYNSNFKIKKLNLKTHTELFGENSFFYHPNKNFYNSKNSQDGKLNS
jgi:hypothetical protein